jgi:hypothetical protein
LNRRTGLRDRSFGDLLDEVTHRFARLFGFGKKTIVAVVTVYVDVFDRDATSQGINDTYLLVSGVKEIGANAHEDTWASDSL